MSELKDQYPEQIRSYLRYEREQVVAQAIPIPEMVLQGIYFLIHNGVVEYVGQSVNLFARLGVHEKLKKYHSLAFIPVKEKKYLGIIETYYIEYFNPPLNIRKVADSLNTFRWKESLNRYRLKQWEKRQ